ncbi:hypothetical protein U1Q18_019689 [Sarracenia purpurea var. burkii]
MHLPSFLDEQMEESKIVLYALLSPFAGRSSGPPLPELILAVQIDLPKKNTGIRGTREREQFAFTRAVGRKCCNDSCISTTSRLLLN